MSAATVTPVPAIGQVWPGQGGTFAGLLAGLNGAPDQVLILADALPPKLSMPWQDSLNWAAKVRAEGHADFAVPDRRESRLLWVNVPQLFEPNWYWTSTQFSRGDAWLQVFVVGYQLSIAKSYEGRARAVRRFNVQSLSHSFTAAAEAQS